MRAAGNFTWVNLRICQIELRKNYGKKEFREDLLGMMKLAGCEDQEIVFLFSDNHILQENFLEDVNNLLNSGEVPNLYIIDL